MHCKIEVKSEFASQVLFKKALSPMLQVQTLPVTDFSYSLLFWILLSLYNSSQPFLIFSSTFQLMLHTTGCSILEHPWYPSFQGKAQSLRHHGTRHSAMPAWLLWHSLPFSILLSQPLCQHCWPSRSFCISLGIHSPCRFITPLEGCLCLTSALFHTISFTLFSYIQENLYRKICPAGDQTAFIKA